MLSWPSGKRVTTGTTAIQIQFAVKETIYNAWIFDKEVKPPFFYQKQKSRR